MIAQLEQQESLKQNSTDFEGVEGDLIENRENIREMKEEIKELGQ